MYYVPKQAYLFCHLFPFSSSSPFDTFSLAHTFSQKVLHHSEALLNNFAISLKTNTPSAYLRTQTSHYTGSESINKKKNVRLFHTLGRSSFAIRLKPTGLNNDVPSHVNAPQRDVSCQVGPPAVGFLNLQLTMRPA